MESLMNKSNLEQMYKTLWTEEPEKKLEILDSSCNPSNEMDFYKTAGSPQINKEDKVLDLGSGIGQHTFIIANQFGCRVTGIDMCVGNLSVARQEKERLGIGDHVEFIEGDIHELPFNSDTFNLIWCRDVLIHASNLPRVFSECSRVLKPKGKMIIYTVFSTKRINEDELTSICLPLNLEPKNLNRDYFEKSFTTAGFKVAHKKEIAGEWIEFNEEKYGHSSQYLMRLARMRREPDKFKKIFGEENYNVMTSNYTWSIFLLIGKLSASIYQLTLD